MYILYGVYALLAIFSVQAWPQCRCNMKDNPVCGSDRLTYGNICFLDCAQKKNQSLYKVHEGNCKSQTKASNTCICAQKYSPVCGSDGITYANVWELRFAKKNNKSLRLVRRGKCIDDVETYSGDCCVCSMEFNPVCGSDGVTYGNPCMLKCAQVKNANLHIAKDGSCGSTLISAKSCFCTDEYNPVCGTNGITYANPCSLNCEKRTQNALEIEHYGKCKKSLLNTFRDSSV